MGYKCKYPNKVKNPNIKTRLLKNKNKLILTVELPEIGNRYKAIPNKIKPKATLGGMGGKPACIA
jgi:hypothetical protein